MRNDHDRAIRADEELPEVVDVELHDGLLRDLEIDPTLLLWDLKMASRSFNRRRPAHGRTLAGRS
jgi:hypothetical protein